MADTSVKYFHSGMPGAPALSGTAGTAIGVLEACLVDGFGLKTVDSLVIAGGVATANISGGHIVEQGSVALVSGAAPAGLNGEWRVSAITASTVVFAVPGIADQTATGSITLKLAPAGWAKTFSGTNKAAFQQVDPASSGMYLRIDDTGTKSASVRGYESMSSVDVGTAPFPTSAQLSGGIFWVKSSVASATAIDWFVVADARSFYFGRRYFPSYNMFEVAVFGDFASAKSVDPFFCAVFGLSTDYSTTPLALNQLCYSTRDGGNRVFSARSHTGVGGSVPLALMSPSLWTASSSTYPSGIDFGPAYPNPADGGLYVAPHNVFEGSTGAGTTKPSAFRGSLPGFYCCPQDVPDATFTGTSKVPGPGGRTLLAVASMNTTSGSRTQTSFIDLDGPWR